MASGLQIWTAYGDLIIDTDTSVALILGSVTVGGSNQTQSGSFVDARLALGRPYHIVTSVEVNGFIGYKPTVTFSGTTVMWSFPPILAGYPFPRSRFIYGLK